MRKYHKAAGLMTLGFVLFFGSATQSIWGIIGGLGMGLVVHGICWLIAEAVNS